jgi:hypothetical protein
LPEHQSLTITFFQWSWFLRVDFLEQIFLKVFKFVLDGKSGTVFRPFEADFGLLGEPAVILNVTWSIWDR